MVSQQSSSIRLFRLVVLHLLGPVLFCGITGHAERGSAESGRSISVKSKETDIANGVNKSHVLIQARALQHFDPRKWLERRSANWWPKSAPSRDRLVADDSPNAPAYLLYPKKWRPDGTVPMQDGKPSFKGTWWAVCYTPEKAEDLGVDMEGYRLGSPEHEAAMKELEDGPIPPCTPKDEHRNRIHPPPPPPIPSEDEEQQASEEEEQQDNPAKSGHSANQVFRTLDTDRDGELNFLDILMFVRQALEKDGHSFPFHFQDLVRQSILKVDLNNDQKVAFRRGEFKRWIRWARSGHMIHALKAALT